MAAGPPLPGRPDPASKTGARSLQTPLARALRKLSGPMKSDDPVAHLRQALSEEAFELYCQPIAALAGLVRAYPMGEVLIRLREEEDAMLPPGEFLPVLEHYGLMPQL